MKTKMSLAKRASAVFLSLAILFTFMPMLPAMNVYAGTSARSMETADSLTLGKAKTNQNVAQNQQHWFKFKTTNEEAYYTVYTHDFDEDYEIVTTVKNSSGEALGWVSGDYTWQNNDESCDTYKLKKNTTYYICVESEMNWNESPIPFTIKVTKTIDDAGNNQSSSAVMKLKTNRGKFECSGDEDWFKLVAPASGKYTFTYKHADDWNYAGTLEYGANEYEFNNHESSDSVTIKLNKGKKVYFKAKPNSSSADKYSILVSYKPYKTSIKSVSRKSKGFTVKWEKKKKSAASGYQIQYATNSKFTKNKVKKTVSGYDKGSYKVTHLKGHTKYYVRVRTYKIINGKKYVSKWSKTKTVTTKR